MIAFGRREFLTVVGGAIAAWGGGGEPTQAAVVEDSLHARAKKQGLVYGANMGVVSLTQDEALVKAFLRECGMVVTEAFGMFTQPEEDVFDFTITDRFAEFAQEHDLLFRGHPLVWHRLNSPWWDEKLNDSGTTAKTAEALLRDRVETLVKRYAGQMYLWDVVNEALVPEHDQKDGLANRPLFKLLGRDYIEIAFRVAAEADPNALLSYNDSGQEYDTPSGEAKRNATLKLLEYLKSKGVPIHVFGLQSHLLGTYPSFNTRRFRDFLSDVASFGVRILISELDVIDDHLAADVEERDRQVAGIYQEYLSVVLDEPAVLGVNTWGISDRYTWINGLTKRSDNLPLRPLPLDDQFNRKPAWHGMAHAFDHSPDR
jgi:endo-1,4-beta-xylanase